MRRLFSVLLLVAPLLVGCPRNEEDAVMFHIYHSLNGEIEEAARQTDITPEYLAALISLESYPPGYRKNERFEPAIYQRLSDLKLKGTPYGRLERSKVKYLTDDELRKYATSYGLTQILGYHCLDIGCSLDDLKGEHHLEWAIAWMMTNYGSCARKHEWSRCFRIHNTGHPEGTTHRDDYVERGLRRMNYYERWRKNKGNFFVPSFDN